jgi:hypothetical protein
MNNQKHYSFTRTDNCDDQNGTVLIMVIPFFTLFGSICFYNQQENARADFANRSKIFNDNIIIGNCELLLLRDEIKLIEYQVK